MTVYICELRVDRGARLFTKVSRPKYPICTRPYAFDHFPHRLKITRTYAPHEVSPEYLKGKAAKNAAATTDKNNKIATKAAKKKVPTVSLTDAATKSVGSGSGASCATRVRSAQKERVNGIARRLLARLGARGAALDATYLLAPRRPRRALS